MDKYKDGILNIIIPSLSPLNYHRRFVLDNSSVLFWIDSNN